MIPCLKDLAFFLQAEHSLLTPQVLHHHHHLHYPHPLAAQDIFEPDVVRVVTYLASTSVIGVFGLVFLRKVMIIDYALPFPSGTVSREAAFRTCSSQNVVLMVTHLISSHPGHQCIGVIECVL